MGALNHSLNLRIGAEIKLWGKQWQVTEMGLNSAVSSIPVIANKRTLRIQLTIEHLHESWKFTITTGGNESCT